MAEIINTYEGEQPESPEQQAELLRVAEGGDPSSATGAANAQRPDWLPEKFKSAEDMAQAYSELEKRLGGQEETEEVPEEQFDTELPQDEVADYLAEQKNLDFDAFASEYYENGGLSDNAYSALEEAGIPRSVVDQYIEGQTAIMDDMRQEAFSVIGGEAEYNQMISWAANNLSEREQAAFNANLNTSNFDQAMFAIQGLAARYRSEAGKLSSNMVYGQTNTPSAGSYQSIAEMTREMNDPRYSSDPAFRQMVASKLKNSSIL